MATEETEPPEGFTTVETPANDSSDEFDTEWVDRPELGESIVGSLLAKKPNRGEHANTILEVRLLQPYGDHEDGDLVCFWSTGSLS